MHRCKQWNSPARLKPIIGGRALARGRQHGRRTLEGIFACPEAATTLAGLNKAFKSGLVSKDERVVLVDTGSGLKSVPTLPEADFPMIESFEDVPAVA